MREERNESLDTLALSHLAHIPNFICRVCSAPLETEPECQAYESLEM